MKNRRISLLMGGLGVVASLSAATKPNLLVIHTDEHNFRTLSCYQKQLPHDQAFVWGDGVNITTPNIDRIANEGAICNRYYCSAAVSTPSRASIVTGLYPQSTGAYRNGDIMRQDIPTFATILRDNGYATSYVGKWHLAGEEGQYNFNVKYNGGFEDNRYMMDGGHKPYFVKREDGSLDFQRSNYKGVARDRLVHLTDYFTDCTIEIIDRDYEKPFCIMLSIPDPHTPDIARPPYDTMFKHLDPEMPLTMTPQYADSRAAWGYSNKTGEMSEFKPEKLIQYFGMVKHIDDAVGRMIEALEHKGVLDNTIVVFTSDHGDMFYEHSRMNKGVPYESSAKIPFVIRYPQKIVAGKVVNTANVNTDFAPTILSLMGIDYKGVKFDGTDMSAEFTNNNSLSTTQRIAMSESNYGNWAMAYDNRYKLILTQKDEPWLLDIERDPIEVVNFYKDPAYKAVVECMQPELLKQLKGFKSPFLDKYRTK